jgi:hypothetical protein
MRSIWWPPPGSPGQPGRGSGAGTVCQDDAFRADHELTHLGEPLRVEQVGDLEGHQDAHACWEKRCTIGRRTRGTGSRPGRPAAVGEVVDEHPPGPGALHDLQQRVHPFVDVDIDGGAVNDLDVRVGDRVSPILYWQGR